VPWIVTIPDPEQDRELPTKLKAEGPGILAWIVRGCLEWQKAGLAPPAAVIAATKEYRNDEDTVGQFLAECTERLPEEKTERKALRQAFDAWCEERGDSATMNARNFHEALLERGIQEAKPWKVAGRTLRGWADLRLVAAIHSGDDMADDEDVTSLFDGLQVAGVAARSGMNSLREPQSDSYRKSVQPLQPATAPTLRLEDV
jgi:phage/plasmid-associated DNA primase